MTDTSAPARPELRVDRLAEALNWVTEHPEAHDQGTWLRRWSEDEARYLPALVCRTTGCLAGWTVVLNGYEPYWPGQVDAVGWTEYVRPTANATPVATPAAHAVPELRTGPYYTVEGLAVQLLGLTAAEQDYLFAPDNTLRDLWEFAHRFSRGAIRVPAALRDTDSAYDGEWENYGVSWGTNEDGEWV